MSGTPPPRTSVATIVRKAFPWLVLAGPKTYRVHEVYPDKRVDLVPEKKGLLPDLPNVSQWCGLAGAEMTPVVGSLVVVEFLDNDETTPAIRNYQPLRQTGGVPALSTIDAASMRLGPSATLIELAVGPLDMSRPVARVGDTVTLAAVNIVAPPGGGPCTVNTISPTITLAGTITSGSSKVKAG